MVIEGIPKVQITRDSSNGDIELLDFSKATGLSFFGKFLLLGTPGSPSHIIAHETQDHEGVFELFLDRAKRIYGCGDLRDVLSRRYGGGYLEIGDWGVRACDAFNDHKKFRERYVRPILEEWARENQKYSNLIFGS